MLLPTAAEQILHSTKGACRELFAHYISDPALIDEVPNDEFPDIESIFVHSGQVGLISMTGPMIQGTLMLFASDLLLEKSWVGDGSPPDDWIGEIANQTLGSIEHKLMLVGLGFDLGLPKVIPGSQYHDFITQDQQLFMMRIGKGVAVVCFQYQCSDDLRWPPSHADWQRASAEADEVNSDVILF